MEFHEIANIFPMMSESEFSELTRDISENGLQEDIWLHPDGRIIDGRNRYKACIKAGITPKYRTWDGKGSLTAFVVSLNLHRRHLSSIQKAAVAVEILPFLEAEAKERQGERNDLKRPNIPEKIPECNAIPKETESRTHAAKLTGTNDRYVSDMKKYKTESPDIYEAAKSGMINGSDAKAISKEPLEKQQEIIKKIESGQVRNVKSALLAEKKTENLTQSKAEILIKPDVYHKDCIEFLNGITDDSVDLLLTDPPYSTDLDNIAEFASSWVSLALSKVKPTGRCYICIGAYPDEIKAYFDILLNHDKFILDNPIIWTYRNTLGKTPNMKYNLNYQMILHLYSDKSRPLDNSVTNEMFSVMDINAPDGRQGDRYHTWQKPDELANRLIRHSTKPDDKIIDCFACTGTFLLSASRLKRIAVGCDNSKENLVIAEQRGCNVIY
jgi:DNA modification methylase